MIKLSDRKTPWIIHEKFMRNGTGEVALIQHISDGRAGQLLQVCGLTGVLPTSKKLTPRLKHWKQQPCLPQAAPTRK